MNYREFEDLINRLECLSEIFAYNHRDYGATDSRTEETKTRREDVRRMLMNFAKDKFTL